VKKTQLKFLRHLAYVLVFSSVFLYYFCTVSTTVWRIFFSESSRTAESSGTEKLTVQKSDDVRTSLHAAALRSLVSRLVSVSATKRDG